MAGSHRRLWVGLATLATLAVLLTAAVLALNPAGLKPRIIQAAERATGRTMTIAGPIGLKWSLTPTITMDDVALANPPGFSRPDMVKVARVELTVGLMPLLRHRLEIEHIALVRPDILMESGPDGHANWIFERESPKPSAEVAPIAAAPREPPAEAPRNVAGGVTAPSPAKPRFSTTLKGVSVVDGQLGWIDPAGHRHDAGLERLNFSEPAERLAHVTGLITFDGRMIGVTAETGSLEDLRSAFGAAPWPVSARLESGGASLTATGEIAHPLQGRDYTFTVDGTVPDPGDFAALLPRIPLQALHAVTAHAEIADGGRRVPVLSALKVGVGSADLNKFVPGARLNDVSLSATGDAPLTVSARLNRDGVQSGISGTVGDLGWLSGGRFGPVAVDLAWDAGAARATVKGTIERPRQLAGFALDVAVDIPDPAAVIGNAPPALKAVTFQTRLTDSPEPIPFQLNSNAGDLEGELAISRTPRLSVAGTITSRRLNLDMMRGVQPPEATAGAPAPNGAPAGASAETPAPPRPPSEGPATDARPAAPFQPAIRETVIPDKKLPLDRIRSTDADLKFNLRDVRLGGTDLAEIDAELAIKDGVLRLDPLSVSAPARHLDGSLTIDAASDPPRLRLTLDSTALPIRPVLAALDLPPLGTGIAEVHADLSGSGDTTRALAASLDGRLGLAIAGGRLNARVINQWLEAFRPLHIEGGDNTDLRCFAMRADAKSGIVALDPLALDTAALIVEASGDVDLGRETLALRVRPRTRIGGTGIALPVRVSGSMRDPRAKVDISPNGFGGGALAGLLIGGKDVMGAAGGGDPCAPALARAREAAPPIAPDGMK